MWDTTAETADTEKQGPPHSGLCVHRAVQNWCSAVPPCGAERQELLSKKDVGFPVLPASGISEAGLRPWRLRNIQKQDIKLYNNRV